MRAPRALMLVCLLGLASRAQAAPRSLCSAAEVVVFDCHARNGKIVSICLRDGKQVVYRFGKAGAVDLAFPTAGAAPGNAGFHRVSSQGSGSSEDDLSFQVGDVRYTVVDLSSWEPGPGGRGGREGRVVVERPGHPDAALRCTPVGDGAWERLDMVLQVNTDAAAPRPAK